MTSTPRPGPARSLDELAVDTLVARARRLAESYTSLEVALGEELMDLLAHSDTPVDVELEVTLLRAAWWLTGQPFEE